MTSWLYMFFKEELMLVLYKIFSKIEKKNSFQTLFMNPVLSCYQKAINIKQEKKLH